MSDEHPVLSVYLDLGGSGAFTPAAREAELGELIENTAPEAGQADAACVRGMLRGMVGFAYGTRGLALFSSGGGLAGEVVPLPCPVAAVAVVDTVPWLEPLAAMCGQGALGVAVLDHHTARLFRGGPRVLVEFATFEDGRQRQSGNGYLGQSRPRHGADDQIAERTRQVARCLLRAHRREAFEDLVVITAGEASAIEAGLHEELRSRLAGLLELDLADAPAREILRTAVQVVEEAERYRSMRGGRACTSPPAGGAAVGPPLPATLLLAHPARARRTARGSDKRTPETQRSAPRPGQEENAACR